MLAETLHDEAQISRAKSRLIEAQERHTKCRSAALRASRGEKLRAQGALQAACRELMQAEINLGKQMGPPIKSEGGR
jgi:hypothetical protein